jgi:DNA-binding NarL/FixJ family response regulator
MVTRVLLIGQGLFRDGLTHLLRDVAALKIIGATDTWADARLMMLQERPDVLIVDHNNARLSEADLAPVLNIDLPDLKIIYLTLAENRMIVHDQRQVSNVMLSDLLGALHASSDAQETP